QLGADLRQRLLARGEMTISVGQPASVQRLALDQPDEVGAGREKVEVVGHGAGEDRLQTLIARQRPGASRSNRFSNLGERAVEDRLVELRFGSKEVARGAAGDASRRAYLGETGGVESLLRKQALGGVQNRRS